jgi:hypothetical protein
MRTGMERAECAGMKTPRKPQQGLVRQLSGGTSRKVETYGALSRHNDTNSIEDWSTVLWADTMMVSSTKLFSFNGQFTGPTYRRGGAD